MADIEIRDLVLTPDGLRTPEQLGVDAGILKEIQCICGATLYLPIVPTEPTGCGSCGIQWLLPGGVTW